MGPNGRSAVHVEAAVAPGEHAFDNRIGVASGPEHLERLIAKKVFQMLLLKARPHLEYAAIGKTVVCDNGLQMGVETLSWPDR